MDMTEHSGEDACLCNGIRFCALCRNSERVRKIFEGQVALQDAATVIAHQQKDERTSSVSFALIGPSKLSLCSECGNVYEKEHVQQCADHTELVEANVTLQGVFVVPDFLTAEEEANLISFFDSPPSPFPPWKDSLSGRRKHEFGPKKNFKKKKVKPADVPAMPVALKSLLERVSTKTAELTGKPYRIVEVSVLEYKAEKISNIDPHIDDTWLWGERIGGINLLSTCAMTFVNKDGVAVDAHLPRRCYFMMSGMSRYDWMHGIRPENVKERRVSITLRELSHEVAADRSTAAPIEAAAINYL